MAHPDANELQAERDARIAQLEARLRTPRARGVRAPVALVGLLLCAALLWRERLDIAYLFAPRAPLTLGAEGDYHLERLAPNRYAQLHGRPTTVGSWGTDGQQVVVLVGVLDTPVVVRRGPVAGEAWEPGQPPPQPNQAPFAVRGRLLRAEEDARFAQGYEALRHSGQLRPRDGALWVLVEGARPGADRGTWLSAGALLVLLLVNVRLLVRALSSPRG